MEDAGVLETERLIIRPFALGDIEDYDRICNLELGWWGAPRDRDWVEERLRCHVAIFSVASPGRPLQGPLAVVLRESGRVIGSVGLAVRVLSAGERRLLGVAPDGPYSSLEYEIGYGLAREYRGKGYAFEATRAVIGYAFEVLGLPRVIADASSGNAPSLKLQARLGMEIVPCEGIGRPGRVLAVLHNGAPADAPRGMS